MRIDLPIDWSYGRGGEWKTVVAEIVDIAPHLAHVATFAVSRDPELPSLWRVHNIETGYRVGERWIKTKRKAINDAKRKLSTISVRKMLFYMKRAHNKLGKL